MKPSPNLFSLGGPTMTPQLFTGMVARASRSGDPLLQNPPE